MFLWTTWSSELGDTVGFTDPRNKTFPRRQESSIKRDKSSF
ncbi:hypothetical protein [Rickettsia asembonensis]|nr:hypothetical protein [Rickettsia asembonensis]